MANSVKKAVDIGHENVRADRYLTKVFEASRSNRNREQLIDSGDLTPYAIQKAAMAENSGTIGGYLVPVDFNATLFQSRDEDSFIWPRATIIPMMSRETLVPTIKQATPAVGESPLFGGMTFSWVSNSGTDITESEPAFQQVSLTARDLLGYLLVSNQFLQDLDPIGEDALFRLFGRAAAWYSEYAFLRGTGAGGGQPTGILNCSALISVTRGSASQINKADIAAMAGRMLPLGWNHAIWICSPSAFMAIANTDGFVSNGNFSSGYGISPAGGLLGRPLFITDKLPGLGTAGDLMFIDPSLYVIGERQQVVIEASPCAGFRTNQTALRVWLRVDGRPLVDTAATIPGVTTTVSPFVSLS